MQINYLKNFYLVQGRPFEVKEMFLEDILRTTGYTNKEMLKYKKEKQRGKLLFNIYKTYIYNITYIKQFLLTFQNIILYTSVSLLYIILY